MSDEIAGANHYAGDVPWTHGGVIESRLVITGGHDGEEVHKALDDLAKEIRTAHRAED